MHAYTLSYTMSTYNIIPSIMKNKLALGKQTILQLYTMSCMTDCEKIEFKENPTTQLDVDPKK